VYNVIPLHVSKQFFITHTHAHTLTHKCISSSVCQNEIRQVTSKVRPYFPNPKPSENAAHRVKWPTHAIFCDACRIKGFILILQIQARQ